MLQGKNPDKSMHGLDNLYTATVEIHSKVCVCRTMCSWYANVITCSLANSTDSGD